MCERHKLSTILSLVKEVCIAKASARGRKREKERERERVYEWVCVRERQTEWFRMRERDRVKEITNLINREKDI